MPYESWSWTSKFIIMPSAFPLMCAHEIYIQFAHCSECRYYLAMQIHLSFAAGINFWHFHCRIFWRLMLIFMCCTLPFVSSLLKSIVQIPLTDYYAYHWRSHSQFSGTSPIRQIKYVYSLFNQDTHVGIEKWNILQGKWYYLEVYRFEQFTVRLTAAE